MSRDGLGAGGHDAGGGGGPGPDPQERLGRYLEGQMDLEEQRAFERELLEDPARSQELYEEIGVGEQLAPPAGSPSAARSPRRPRARRWWWVPPLAAAAVLLFLLRPAPEGPTRAPAWRGSAERLDVVGPRGSIAGPNPVFRWHPVDGSHRYQFELYDAQSQLVLSEATPDSFLRLSTPLPGLGGRGFWRVSALDSLAVPLALSAPVPLVVKD